MKREKLLQMLDCIDESYLSSAAESMAQVPAEPHSPIKAFFDKIGFTKSHGIRRSAVIAAAILFAVGILISVIPDTASPALPITEHRICGETLDGPIRVETGSKNLHCMEFGGRYADLFIYKEADRTWYLAVEASVVEILPDPYEEPKTGKRYHILRMQTHEVLSGENIPEEFYFRLEEQRSPELDGFDRLILGIRQIGIERYVMYNAENGQAETFSLLFEPTDTTNLGSVIALEKRDGMLCVTDRLTLLGGWSETEHGFEEGAASEEIKQSIHAACLENIGTDHTPRVYTASDFCNEETARVFARMASEKNAVFVQRVSADGYGGRYITFTKYIAGFETSDQFGIFLSGNGDIRLDLSIDRITDAEAKEAPALAPILRALTEADIVPPHTDEAQTMEITHFSIVGWYDKSEDSTLRPLIKLRWYLTDGRVTYLDDLYLLVAPDGSYTPVERDELKKMIGNDKHIENAEYNIPLFFNKAQEQIMPLAAD